MSKKQTQEDQASPHDEDAGWINIELAKDVSQQQASSSSQPVLDNSNKPDWIKDMHMAWDEEIFTNMPGYKQNYFLQFKDSTVLKEADDDTRNTKIIKHMKHFMEEQFSLQQHGAAPVVDDSVLLSAPRENLNAPRHVSLAVSIPNGHQRTPSFEDDKHFKPTTPTTQTSTSFYFSKHATTNASPTTPTTQPLPTPPPTTVIIPNRKPSLLQRIFSRTATKQQVSFLC